METIMNLTLDDLRKVTWDYSEEELIGYYHEKPILLFMFEVKGCSDINPLTIRKCNVAEGWVEYLECENPHVHRFVDLGFKRAKDGSLKTMKLNCKIVVDVLDRQGNVIVTLS